MPRKPDQTWLECCRTVEHSGALYRPIVQVNRPLPPSGLPPRPLSLLTFQSGKVRVYAGLPKISVALGFKLEFSGTKLAASCSHKRQSMMAGQGNQEAGLRHALS